MKQTKICLYAHHWHYLDNYQPLIDYLQAKKIAYHIITFRPKEKEAFLKYQKKYGLSLTELSAKLKESPLKKIPFFGPFFNLKKQVKQLKKLFEQEKFSHLVLSDDRVFFAHLVLKAAQELKIIKALYPVESIQTKEDQTGVRTSSRSQKIKAHNLKGRMLSWLVKKLYPQNFNQTEKGEEVQFYPSRTALQFKLLNILPQNPWVVGANHLDLVAVNSRHQQQEKIASGIPSSIIKVTGFPPHDLFINSLKNRERNKAKILKKFQLPNKKIILFISTNYPQIWQKQELGQVYQKIKLLLKKTSDILGADHQIIFKVHPNIEKQAEKANLQTEKSETTITLIKKEETVYELIAVSDIVLMFSSSAVVAALAADMPLLCYQLGMPHFDYYNKKYQSMTKLYSPEELEQTLLKIRNNTFLTEEWLNLRKKDRKNFALLDGKNTARFAQLLFETS